MNAVLGAVLEAFHRPLDRPEHRAVRQHQLDIHLSLRIVIVATPDSPVTTTDDFADVRAYRDNTRSQLLVEEAPPDRLPISAVFIEEAIDLPQAVDREVCSVA